ncbi:hypothetical protein [Caldimonas tepidiphila]|uniref:hypothetical protein n=1 Tax=Caldimonas tepidiphila TaxID=2315841 RepID=UPI000E5B13A4|nr:hypothetical protein [Caldimonas tepidiphila]
MPQATLPDPQAPQPIEAPAANPGGHPGDEVPPGTPQSAEDVCGRCAGRGWLDAGVCPDCAGSGRVTVNVGDA